ncbi:MAG: hypothetical protein ACYC7A_19330 [Thermoanaerobaculia bacterium]
MTEHRVLLNGARYDLSYYSDFVRFILEFFTFVRKYEMPSARELSITLRGFRYVLDLIRPMVADRRE